MTWVLIVFMAGSSAGVFGTAEFNNKDACFKAKAQLEVSRYASHRHIFCAEKGNKN